MGSEKTKASDAWRVESRKSYRTHREVPSRKNTDCGQISLDGSNHIRVRRVFDDAPPRENKSTWCVFATHPTRLKSWGHNWSRKGHGSNAGHSSGVAQGQRSLNRCSGRDFQHEVFAPTATAAFHSQTVAAGMLLQQRPTRRVLSYATAKLLRDEAESMVPNIDPEQVRKLAGWGLTQNDRASFVGWSQSPISLGF